MKKKRTHAATSDAAPVRKQTKKKKTKKQLHDEAWAKDRLARTTSGLMRGMIRDIRKKSGDPMTAMLSDWGAGVIGIACPSFALEYMLCNNVIPLGKVMQLYGERGLGKSAFGFELMRLFRKYGGIGNLCEHESGKFNDLWAKSIIGQDNQDCFGIIRCDSVEGWEEALIDTQRYVKRIMLGTGQDYAAGKVFPYLQIVDSIMGKPSRETIKAIEKARSAGRAHPVEALSITKFITTYAGMIEQWPFMLLCVNHQKVHAPEGGMRQKKRSGGQTIDFQGSFELEISRVKRLRGAAQDGNRVKLMCEKNSYGPDKRWIEVDVVWWEEEDEETGERQQRTVWDWDGATARRIVHPTTKDDAKWTEAKKLTGLVYDTESKGHSAILGCKKPVPYFELGRAIRQRPEMVRELRRIFSVRERKVFEPGVDYDEQMRQAAVAVAKEHPKEFGDE